MKHKDWFVAGTLVTIGLLLLFAASTGMGPVWWNMGWMMVWAMLVPWAVFIILFVLVMSLSSWGVSTVARTFMRHQCPVCRHHVKADWKICPNCGAQLVSVGEKVNHS
ncbi:MAG: zinc ribbon domain-containing protein [Alicyclobacillus sp.]|nr:zinc ribbon domain-containing protein [Alicyclobacillus sp.]